MDKEESRVMSLNSITNNPKHEFYEKMVKAIEALKMEPGVWESREQNYEVAIYRMPGFVVIIYPHKSSNGHYNLRCRSQGERKNSVDVLRIKTRLYYSQPHDNTFYWSGMSIVEAHTMAKELNLLPR